MFLFMCRAVLEELKARWEQKLVESNVFDAHVGEVDGDNADGCYSNSESCL